MHQFVTEMCTHVHISVTKWCIVGYGTSAFWDFYNRAVVFKQSWSEQPGEKYRGVTEVDVAEPAVGGSAIETGQRFGNRRSVTSWLHFVFMTIILIALQQIYLH